MDRTTVSFRSALRPFRLINFDTLMAFIDRTSSSSTATNLSPTRNLFASTLPSLIAWTTGPPTSGESITTPSLPAGAAEITIESR